MKNLITRIEQIAQDNPEGFTVYLPSLEMAKDGWAIANRFTQNKFGREGLEFVLEYAMKHNRIIGGWYHEGKFYYDAIILESDEQVAISQMIIHNQIGIYNIRTQKFIKNRGF